MCGHVLVEYGINMSKCRNVGCLLSGDTSGQMLVTLSGRGDVGQAVVSESANQVYDQLSRCGGVDMRNDG